VLIAGVRTAPLGAAGTPAAVPVPGVSGAPLDAASAFILR
jgi:hypothetical protein